MPEKLPIIEQLHDADDNRQRADVLLRCPDAILLKYAPVFADACRRAMFEEGEAFVIQRVAVMQAVRNAAGGLPGKLAMDIETMRAQLAAYAAGAPPAPLDV